MPSVNSGTGPMADAPHNIHEYTVGEISQAVKRSLEDRFDHVRVQGEVGRVSYHGSGHLYFTLKDEAAALDGVCWRTGVARLGLRLEEGMEVVCTGRISSYPRSSRYQLVIASVALAGEGALLKLLEDRRRRLVAEGLFDAVRKRALPFLPEVVGVVTSPGGAAIRDILHRLADRFPRRVVLWPVPVQGAEAAGRVAAAIAGFDALAPGGAVPRPDLLIVARGGGSLEDLLAFNEEIVVRAAAACRIPLISAIGHETDTTLIDYAADRRAPTPTAAAELAVPVRTELAVRLDEGERRGAAALHRSLRERARALDGLGRRLPDPERLLEQAWQDFDLRSDRLDRAAARRLDTLGGELARLGAGLRHPRDQLGRAGDRAADLAARLLRALRAVLNGAERAAAGLDAETRLANALAAVLHDRRARLAAAAALVESLSYKRVLARGYAVVRDAAGRAIARAEAAAPGRDVTIEFADGRRAARIVGSPEDDGDPQGRLF